MSDRAPTDEPTEPATLFRVMQNAIAEGLRERYAPSGKMSHQLFVLAMQMNDRARRASAQAKQAGSANGAAAPRSSANHPPADFVGNPQG